ncbi:MULTISPECIES: hypothetical protein [Actinoalloteichus]|uniref:Uncharacterized protein n=1 Tax=Actinoalloteichus fjordicus TaxID=1612552 RepID=A0AAC9LEB8_9PSEU|nr:MULTISPECIES: hypothetical protein [Actinoalloteichus]APU15285.1 hypothetical protein UA74_16185 [Actinoalloteichus fjordicus]APU21330.1 hypothetical protein UA75_16610 [Actinoalloteichus sp. GBA129-24]
MIDNDAADFYLGRGTDARWLGSLATDGDPASILPGYGLDVVRDASDYFATLARLLHDREVDEPFGAHPVSWGWPWPYETSAVTGWTYAWDGGLWMSRLGSAWTRISRDPTEFGAAEPMFPTMLPATTPATSYLDAARPGRVHGWAYTPTADWPLPEVAAAILTLLTLRAHHPTVAHDRVRLRYAMTLDPDTRVLQVDCHGYTDADLRDTNGNTLVRPHEAEEDVHRAIAEFGWHHPDDPTDRRLHPIVRCLDEATQQARAQTIGTVTIAQT